MKYFIDLDDTLVSSTTLNNDAYNFALENFGYDRINTNERITREIIKDYKNLEQIIKFKQRYFTSDWLPYRLIVNNDLILKLNDYQRSNCYLWTKAEENRTNKILSLCDLNKYFNYVVFDNKQNYVNSVHKLKEIANSKQIIIYENNHKFFENQNYKIIDEITNKNFNIKGYLV